MEESKIKIDLRGQDDDWHAHMHRKKPRDFLVFDAVELAAQRHRGQMRKGTRIPYMVHLMNVASILAERECESEVVAGGILHDIVEDTPTELAEIVHRFGDRIGTIVHGTSEHDKSLPWRERKEHTIAFMQRDANQDVLLVSCADKLDNIRSIARDLSVHGDRVWKKFNAPKNDQAWYYRALAEVFLSRGSEDALGAVGAELTSCVRQVFGPGPDGQG